MLLSTEKWTTRWSRTVSARSIKWAVACGILLLFVPRDANAALAQLFGGSGYSADLSHNLAIRHQQLICDPVPGNGSASVLYDPSVVSVFSIYNEAGYGIQNEYVGVLINGSKEVQAAGQFFATSPATCAPQWGYVQVQWFGPNAAAPVAFTVGEGPPTLTGFSLDATAGPVATNTFGLEFKYLPSSNDVVANYTVYAEPIGYPIFNGTGFSPPDFITQADALPGQMQTPITDIAPASVGAALPEPSMGLFLASAVAGLFATRVAGRRRIDLLPA